MSKELDQAFLDAVAEVNNQLTKWGEQNHPCLDQTLLNRERSCTPQRMCENYEIPSETRAKFLCQNAFEKNEGTYAHIAVEELSESISEFEPEKRYIEVIQLAAVCINWAAKIKRIDLKKES